MKEAKDKKIVCIPEIKTKCGLEKTIQKITRQIRMVTKKNDVEKCFSLGRKQHAITIICTTRMFVSFECNKTVNYILNYLKSCLYLYSFLKMQEHYTFGLFLSLCTRFHIYCMYTIRAWMYIYVVYLLILLVYLLKM